MRALTSTFLLSLLLVGVASADSLNVRLIGNHNAPGMACHVAVNRNYAWATPQQVAVATESRFGLDCYGRLWCLLLNRPVLYPESSTFSASRYDGNQWLEPELVFTGGLASGLGGFDATRAQDGRLWAVFVRPAWVLT